MYSLKTFNIMTKKPHRFHNTSYRKLDKIFSEVNAAIFNRGHIPLRIRQNLWQGIRLSSSKTGVFQKTKVLL